ncbi:unnamed protein product [Leptidea sinapis]|uniref:PiggyBac transposable element-derived protein domain-containing protein n=1 Tax=Leptidea sinapis TaxID=189913 RepID=A0A5E4QFD1_9NEOP|nr:unnamed protein product [Leptidea sinapis]
MKGRQLLLSVVLYQVVFIQDAPFMAFLYTRQNYCGAVIINEYYCQKNLYKSRNGQFASINKKISIQNWNGYRA